VKKLARLLQGCPEGTSVMLSVIENGVRVSVQAAGGEFSSADVEWAQGAGDLERSARHQVAALASGSTALCVFSRDTRRVDVALMARGYTVQLPAPRTLLTPLRQEAVPPRLDLGPATHALLRPHDAALERWALMELVEGVAVYVLDPPERRPAPRPNVLPFPVKEGEL
jgi:hypothetical protein